MNPYPFGLNDAVNDGARKTRPVLYQNIYLTYFKNLTRSPSPERERQVARSSYSDGDTLSWPKGRKC